MYHLLLVVMQSAINHRNKNDLLYRWSYKLVYLLSKLLTFRNAMIGKHDDLITSINR